MFHFLYEVRVKKNRQIIYVINVLLMFRHEQDIYIEHTKYNFT